MLVAAILDQVRLDGFVAKIGPTGEDRQQQVAGIQRIVLGMVAGGRRFSHQTAKQAAEHAFAGCFRPSDRVRCGLISQCVTNYAGRG